MVTEFAIYNLYMVIVSCFHNSIGYIRLKIHQEIRQL